MSTLVNRADFFGIGLNRTVDMGFQMDLGMGSCGGGGGGVGADSACICNSIF